MAHLMTRYGLAYCQAQACRAPIRFVPTDTAADSSMPIDFDANPDGNIIMTGDMRDGYYVAHVVHKGEDVPDGTTRWMPHFKTCPAADEFRKDRTS